LFEREGIECHERYSYGHSYNRFLETPFSVPYRTLARLRRAAWTVLSPGYDLIFFQRTALPTSALPESIRARFRVPTVFDFDDAIYLGANGEPSHFRSRAFRSAVESASWVVAGNEHLARAAAVPAKTSVIPTVVDTTALTPGARRPDGIITIGWMGTSSNYVHVRSILPELLSLIKMDSRLRLRIVSNRPLPELSGHDRTEFIQWSQDRELELLRSFDIGLMPLTDSEIARGKCAFKILQYMAVGVPVVASAVGANIDVLGDGAAGRLVVPGRTWAGAISDLANGSGVRMEMGQRGRDTVQRQYSREAVVGRYTALFRKLTALRGPDGSVP
jgi:glycosyltransferase involved in cell wall biosynthesis